MSQNRRLSKELIIKEVDNGYIITTQNILFGEEIKMVFTDILDVLNYTKSHLVPYDKARQITIELI
jgi:hypothetical protein